MHCSVLTSIGHHVTLKIYTIILKGFISFDQNPLTTWITASENSFFPQRHKIRNSNESFETISLPYKNLFFGTRMLTKEATPDTVLLLWRCHENHKGVQVCENWRGPSRLDGGQPAVSAQHHRSQFWVQVRDGAHPHPGRLHLSFGGV